MHITGEWLTAEGTQTVLKMLESAGFQAFAVGGCVRNALLGAPIADVDISTDARPERVTELAREAGLKVIPTGLEHGTVTVICAGEPYEVTTFRNDVVTDGRRAVIAYSTDIMDDAVRRDFTVNALYVRADGTVVDPLRGIKDIETRRIRFIEDPAKRIEEDYLRILRFFRFTAWYGDPSAGMDPDGLAACASHIDGIAKISKERIGAEMAKLLSAPDPAPTVAAMAASGVLAQVISGGDHRSLAALVHLEGNFPVRWQRRLAVLGGEHVGRSLRLSRADKKHVLSIRHALEDGASVAENAYYRGEKFALDAKLVESALISTALPTDLEEQVKLGANATFPVRAADLMDRIDTGPALGATLKRLETTWVKSKFSLDKAALMKLVE